jgi:type IV secretory pathway VirB2 component (pilin)
MRAIELMRGLQLADEISAPSWMVQSLRGLVSWRVLVLGIQLMCVAWFAGLSFARNSRYGVSDDVKQ